MPGRSSELGEMPSSMSVSLIARLRDQDGDAWQRLVKLYGPLVYRWCREAGLQANDATDVGQEVFRAVATSIDRFRRDRPGDSFRGWLWTIMKNKVRDHFRGLASRPEATGGTDAYQQFQQLPDSPSEVSDADRASGVSRRALDLIRSEFESRTWEAFWGVAVGRGKPADVAADLGMTVAAVYMAKSRVLRRLREEFTELLD